MKTVKFIVLALMVTSMAIAQDGSRNHGNKQKQDLAPEQIATLHTKKLTLALDLSSTQQNQVKELSLEQAKLRKQHREEREALKAKEESKKPTSEERYNKQIARLDKQIAHKAQMKQILSAEQYTKWETMGDKKMRNRKKGKHGSKKEKN